MILSDWHDPSVQLLTLAVPDWFSSCCGWISVRTVSSYNLANVITPIHTGQHGNTCSPPFHLCSSSSIRYTSEGLKDLRKWQGLCMGLSPADGKGVSFTLLYIFLSTKTYTRCCCIKHRFINPLPQTKFVCSFGIYFSQNVSFQPIIQTNKSLSLFLDQSVNDLSDRSLYMD